MKLLGLLVLFGLFVLAGSLVVIACLPSQGPQPITQEVPK